MQQRGKRVAPRVRAARPDDEPALLALDDARCWPDGTWVVPPGAQQVFFDERTPPRDVLVVEDPRDPRAPVVGYAALRPPTTLPTNAHVLHIVGIVVDPELRGFGLGRRLLDACVVEAHRRGARKLGLRVLATNPAAIRLYRAAGFVEEGRLRGEFHLGGADVDDLVMARMLP